MKTKLILSFFLIVYTGFALAQETKKEEPKPAFATEYMMDHLTIAEEQQKNITVELYDAGHMMYLHPSSLVRYKKDLASFIDND